MKMFLKKILVLASVIIAATTVINLSSPAPAYADSHFSCRDFLGLTSWDCGITEFTDEESLKSNIIIIAANIFVDITVIAAYLVLGYVIYGGYLYIFSSGDPGKTAAGKKTLIHAFTGLAIVMLSSVILNAIRIALIQNKSFSDVCTLSPTDPNNCPDPSIMVTNLIQWIIGIAGIVAGVFAIIGGISYMTSQGDPGKLKKAKDTIMYALIGLAIVGLAEIITAFISNMIREAKTEPTSYINQTIIAKEHHEN